jgi:hypothetical protein
MIDVFFQSFEEYNYVVHVNFDVLTIKSKKIIDLSLHIK